MAPVPARNTIESQPEQAMGQSKSDIPQAKGPAPFVFGWEPGPRQEDGERRRRSRPKDLV